MATYGLLFDYEYCTHCGSCIVSCKEEHGYPVGQSGIAVLGDGPWQIAEDEWNWNWYPVPTDLCDLCANRTQGQGRERRAFSTPSTSACGAVRQPDSDTTAIDAPLRSIATVQALRPGFPPVTLTRKTALGLIRFPPLCLFTLNRYLIRYI